MIRRIAFVSAVLSAAACVDTTADGWCQSHPEICQTSVTSIFPTEGPSSGNYEVTLTGLGFEADTEVLFSGKPLQVTAREGRTVIRGRIPANPVGPAEIRLRNSNGEVVVSGKFTYRTPTAVSALRPTTGSKRGGTRITITGENIHPGTRVFVGTAEATSVEIATDGRSLTALTPPGTSLQPQSVLTDGPGGLRTLAASFSYDPWERVRFDGLNQANALRQFARGGTAGAGILYAASSFDLYRSLDNGASWTPLEPPQTPFHDVATDPSNPSRVLLSSNEHTFWSHDSGNTWAAAAVGNRQLEGTTLAFRIDGVAYASNHDGFYRSQDGGRTFTRVSQPPMPFSQLRVHGVNQDVVIGYGYTGYAISHDGGATWPYAQTETSSYAFVEPGVGAGEVWMVRYPEVGGHYIVERSENYGASFQAPAVPPPDGYWAWFAIDRATGAQLLGDYGHVLRLPAGGSAWTQVGSNLETIVQVGFDLTGAPLAMVDAEGPGVWNGTHWIARTTGMASPWVSGVTVDSTTSPRSLYVGTRSGLVLHSTDDGVSWNRLPPLPYRADTQTVVSTFGSSARTVYASLLGSIYRWSPGDPSWTMETSASGSLLQEPMQRDVLYAFGNDGFFKKQPNGVWEDFGQGLPANSAGWRYSSAATLLSAGQATVFVAVFKPGEEARVYARRQIDVAWQPVGNAILLDGDDWIVGFGASATHLILSVVRSYETHLWRLPHGGDTWTQQPDGEHTNSVDLFLTDPTNQNRIYGITQPPLLVSNDNGATWTHLEDRYRSWDIHAAAIDPAAPTDLFLATGAAGLYRTWSAGQ